MKASVSFRDDSPGSTPLFRAKVPIGVLSLPFVAGVSSSSGPSSPSVRLDLSTAFSAGPSVRLSYFPNDLLRPFSLTLKSGAGPFGSPSGSPFSLSAHLSVHPSSNPSKIPAFSLVLRPKFGDFALRKSLNSADLVAAPTTGEENSPSFENGTHNPVVGIRTIESFDGFGVKNLAVAKDAVAGFFKGMAVTSRSTMPVWNHALLNFTWGLRVPTEMSGFLFENDGWEGRMRKARKAGVSVAKLPSLVLKKISIEQSCRTSSDKSSKQEEKRNAAVESPNGTTATEGFSLMKHQLEMLQAESLVLRRAVKDLEAEIGGRSNRNGQSAPHLSSKADLTNAGGGPKAAEDIAKKSADVGDELRKALDSSRRK